MLSLNDILKTLENQNAFSISMWIGGMLFVIWFWATAHLIRRRDSRLKETEDASMVDGLSDIVQSGEIERNTVVGGFKLHEWGFEGKQK